MRQQAVSDAGKKFYECYTNLFLNLTVWFSFFFFFFSLERLRRPLGYAVVRKQEISQKN